MRTNDMAEKVREGAIVAKPAATAGGTDGGWNAAKPLKTRYASPTGLTSFDGESAWRQYDPHNTIQRFLKYHVSDLVSSC